MPPKRKTAAAPAPVAGTTPSTTTTPKKRVSKKAAAAAAAAVSSGEAERVDANANGVSGEVPIIVTSAVDGEQTESVPSSVEPVVLQLMISNDRMTEIVNSTNAQESYKLEPEPFMTSCGIASAPMESVQDGHSAAHNQVCFWCCHPIVDKEYGMPIRYDSVHNSFTLYGCFCSLECVAAHNFSVNMGSDRAWEIHSWIQLLARRYGFAGRVRPAPNKFLLKMFNGPLTIEEFRATHKDLTRTYVMNIPPFIHVASQMEVLNTSFIHGHASADKAISKGTRFT